jgi:DNA-directed RNA polymerase subunit omega
LFFEEEPVMARVTVEDCLEKVPNRLELIILAAKRTRQLLEGAEPLISNTRGNKEPIVALREVSAGKIVLKTTEGKLKKNFRKRRRITKYFRNQDED